MKHSTICNTVCLAIFFALFAYIINMLYKIGEFSLLFPKNVRGCQRIEGYHGCEDFAYFEDGTVIMSCDDRSWLGYQGVFDENLSQRIANQANQGSLHQLSPSNNYKTAREIKLTNYNFKDFHPLGIATLEDKSGKWLYVTDNHRDKEKVNIFKVKQSKNEIELEFYASIVNDDFGMVNDVIAIPDSNGAFYVTIWLDNEPGTWGCFAEVYLMLPVSYTLFCQPPDEMKDFLTNRPKNKNDKLEYEFNCRRVIENMKMVNGITRSKDSKRVYISETIRKTMNIYDRNPKTNDLTLVKKVSTLSGCDNLEVADDGNIYLGCHPKGLTFQFHAAYPDKLVAPSRILKYQDNNSENDEMEIVLESLGEIIAGSSLGFITKGQMLVGSVHDDCYLLCENFNPQ